MDENERKFPGDLFERNERLTRSCRNYPFRFELTEQVFRYAVDCELEGRLISLQRKKLVLVACAQDASLFSGEEEGKLCLSGAGSPYSRIRCKPLLLSFRPPCFLIGKERYNGSVPCGYMNMQGTRGAVSRGRNLTAIR